MKDLALSSFYAGRVPMFWGLPGVGKTNWLLSLAQDLRLRPFFICLNHRADNEVHGQPVIAKNTVRLGDRDFTVVEQAPPDYVIGAIQSTGDGYKGALIGLDDFTTSSPSTAASALAMTETPHRIGGLELPPYVVLVGLANPTNWTAGGWDLKPASVRRFDHYKFVPSATEWSDSFPSYWGRPPKLGFLDFEVTEEEWSPHRAMVASFVRCYPDVIYKVPKDEAKRTGCWTEGDDFQVGGFSCPATLDAMSRHLAIAVKQGRSEDALQQSLIACVGSDVAIQFLTFRDRVKMPGPREILDKPELISEVPANRSDCLYYAVQACVELCRAGKKRADENPRNQKLADQALRDWEACWVVTACIAMGAPRKVSYRETLESALAGEWTLHGPLDIAAIAVRALVDRDVYPRGVDFNKLPEIELFPEILKAAGVNWSSRKS